MKFKSPGLALELSVDLNSFAEVKPYTNKVTGQKDPYLDFGGGRFAHISTIKRLPFNYTTEDGIEISRDDLVALLACEGLL